MRRRGNPEVSPDGAAALWRDSGPVRQETVTVKCQLVTPMYGGGVTAGEVDRAMPIRASAVRGQLRFWWRLIHGRGRPSTEVFEEECAIWGGITTKGPVASQVAVRVDCKPVVDERPMIKADSPDVPNYGLIWEGDSPPKLLNRGYEFELTLEFHGPGNEQVLNALRWWATFGGVGARTRRGFGGLRASGTADLNFVAREEAESCGAWLLCGQRRSCAEAWKDALRTLQLFRQGTGVGRARGSRGPGSPGSSNWPEAATIRRMAKAGPAVPKRPDANLFPRAVFGLPIVFQFAGQAYLNDTLEAEDDDRMASPLILRPYFDGSAFRPMALLLPDWRERISVPVKFKDSGRKGLAWPPGEGERSRLAGDVEPMKDRGSDPLTAFMHYFAKRTGAEGGGR